MRRIALAVVTTTIGLVLLLSFKTHSVGPASAAAPVVASTPSTGESASPAPSASSSPAATSTATATYVGDAADTRYGPVQVEVAVKDGKVVAVQATEYPQQDPRDAQINAYAIPVLNQEATQAAGSSTIDMVSGATFTSEGYLQSLQSALDKAKLG